MNYPMLMPLLTALPLTAASALGLNVTAISASNGSSILECWQLSAAPSDFMSATNYPVGNFEDSYLGVIAPKTHVGQAWAPQVQYSFVLSGLVHIQAPAFNQETWIQGGKYGIIIAADTKDVSKEGHITDFPAGSDTVIAQFPFAAGMLPNYKVLYQEPCRMQELIGI